MVGVPEPHPHNSVLSGSLASVWAGLSGGPERSRCGCAGDSSCGIPVRLPCLPCDHGWVPSPLLAAHHCRKVLILGPFKLGHLRDFKFMILGVPHPEGAFNRSGAPSPGRCPRTVVLPSSVWRRHAGFICVCSAPSGGYSGTRPVQGPVSQSFLQGGGWPGQEEIGKAAFFPLEAWIEVRSL